MIKFRPITTTDRKAVLSLFNTWLAAEKSLITRQFSGWNMVQVDLLISNPRECAWVATEDEKLLGFVTCVHDIEPVRLPIICVLPTLTPEQQTTVLNGLLLNLFHQLTTEGKKKFTMHYPESYSLQATWNSLVGFQYSEEPHPVFRDYLLFKGDIATAITSLEK